MDSDRALIPRPFTTSASNTQPLAVKRFRVSGSEKSMLDRQGRALCRLLHNDGMPVSEIAAIVDVNGMTVKRSICNGYATKDNTSEDYKFVDEEFITKYNIMPPSTRTVRVTEAIVGGNDSELARRDEEMQPSGSVTKWIVPPIPSLRRGLAMANRTEHQSNDSEAASGSASVNRSRRHTIPARFCPITQERRFSAVSQSLRLDKDSDRESNGLRDFLSSLKFNLAEWYPSMEAKGLRTEEDLLAIADWDEERLDRVFKKLLPDMPELHIYALTEGVMDLVKPVRE